MIASLPYHPIDSVKGNWESNICSEKKTIPLDQIFYINEDSERKSDWVDVHKKDYK